MKRHCEVWLFPGRYVEPLAEPIHATIRQEIVRACGLQDAVKAADAWVGGEISTAPKSWFSIFCRLIQGLYPK